MQDLEQASHPAIYRHSQRVPSCLKQAMITVRGCFLTSHKTWHIQSVTPCHHYIQIVPIATARDRNFSVNIADCL